MDSAIHNFVVTGNVFIIAGYEHLDIHSVCAIASCIYNFSHAIFISKIVSSFCSPLLLNFFRFRSSKISLLDFKNFATNHRITSQKMTAHIYILYHSIFSQTYSHLKLNCF